MILEQKIRKAIPELYVEFGQGKPIQLNHVLEYWINNTQVATASKFKNDLNWIVSEWNLKSNLLSDQSDELKNFINTLD